MVKYSSWRDSSLTLLRQTISICTMTREYWDVLHIYSIESVLCISFQQLYICSLVLILLGGNGALSILSVTRRHLELWYGQWLPRINRKWNLHHSGQNTLIKRSSKIQAICAKPSSYGMGSFCLNDAMQISYKTWISPTSYGDWMSFGILWLM